MTYAFHELARRSKHRSLTVMMLNRFFCLVGMLLNGASVGLAEPTSIDPNQLVLQAVHRAIWGPSLSCRIRQHSTFGEQRLEAEGQYWQTGQGTGQLKMILELKADKYSVKSKWMQVSDGRLLWTSISDGEPPRRVYLDRVRQSLGSMVRDPVSYTHLTLPTKRIV